jgi:hypothetical protein
MRLVRPSMFRLLQEQHGLTEVADPPSNLLAVIPAKQDDEKILQALDPDNPYDHAVHGL